MPLPWTTAGRPRAPTSFELSIITGSRATSGSVAIYVQEGVHRLLASSRSASMLTSIRFAPPRTCSSATSTAP